MPPFSALFADSSREGLSNVTPIFCAKLLDIYSKTVIFFLAPWAFDHRWIENLLPSMEALNICPLIKEGSNAFPIPGSELSNELSQFIIFFRVPVSFSILWILRNRELINRLRLVTTCILNTN
jgi:hypothetical protein